MRLPVMIARTQNPDPAPDPVIYLAGGGGHNHLRYVNFLMDAVGEVGLVRFVAEAAGPGAPGGWLGWTILIAGLAQIAGLALYLNLGAYGETTRVADEDVGDDLVWEDTGFGACHPCSPPPDPSVGCRTTLDEEVAASFDRFRGIGDQVHDGFREVEG